MAATTNTTQKMTLDEKPAVYPETTAVPLAELATSTTQSPPPPPPRKCCGGGKGVTPTVVSQSYPAQYVVTTSKQLEVMQNRYQTSAGMGILFIKAGHLDFSGRIIVPRKIRIMTILHGSHIDLTQAQFVHPVTDIEVVSILGGCKVFIPDGVQVEVFGVAILGNFKQKGEPSMLNALSSSSAPLLRIRGVSILGCVNVQTDKTRPPVAMVDVQ